MDLIENLVVIVAEYDQDSDASIDFIVLKAACAVNEIEILSVEVASRKTDGKIRVRQHEEGAAASAIGWGAAYGLAIGMFSPLALAATITGAAVGAVCHEIAKHQDEKRRGDELDQYLAPGTTAILVLADGAYADRLDRVLNRAARRITKAVDADDARKLDRALDGSDTDVIRTLRS